MTDVTTGAIIGATSAIAGGIVVQYIESTLRRKNRRNELVAEHELDACAWIFPLFKDIDAHLNMAPPDFNAALIILLSNEKKFWSRHLFLPDEVSNSWIGCRNSVSTNDAQKALDHIHRGYEKIYDLLNMHPFKGW